jgi:hypothetical protein
VEAPQRQVDNIGLGVKDSSKKSLEACKLPHIPLNRKMKETPSLKHGQIFIGSITRPLNKSS